MSTNSLSGPIGGPLADVYLHSVSLTAVSPATTSNESPGATLYRWQRWDSGSSSITSTRNLVPSGTRLMSPQGEPQALPNTRIGRILQDLIRVSILGVRRQAVRQGKLRQNCRNRFS